MSDILLDAIKLADNYKAKYDQLVRAGNTSEAMDVYHDKWQPALHNIISVRKQVFAKDCTSRKAKASSLNKELFNLATKDIKDDCYKPNTWHYGKIELGILINTLEETYNITRK